MPARATLSVRPRAQRGVVLFIALIAMVVLSLAGVALIRAVDTSGSAAGNIAFREASVTAVNLAIEQAVDWLYVSKTLNPDTDVDPAHHYYGKLQAGELPNGLPAVLGGTYATMKTLYPFGAADVYPTTNAEVRSVIERICSPAAPVPPAPAVLHVHREDRVLRLAAAEGLAGEDVDEAQGADAPADSALSRHDPHRSSGHQHGNVRADDAALIADAQGRLP